MMAKIDALLEHMLEHQGSALHIGSQARPRMRQLGALRELDGTLPMAAEEVTSMLQEVAGEAAWDSYLNHFCLDFSYALEDGTRFRVHCFHRRGGPAAVIRASSSIQSGDELGLPAMALRLAHATRGLVLVAGPPGSGKSTTIAALLAELGDTHAKHVITIEHPVELVHDPRMSSFSQREVGTHCHGQREALQAALLQSPDAIMMAEPQTPDAAHAALDAAEAGILVVMEMMANGAARALERLIGIFAVERQAAARRRVAEVFAGVISQLLLSTVDGRERCLAVELVLRSRSVPVLIRDGDLSGLESLVRRSEQMQTMDDALKALVTRRRISMSTAHDHARDKSRFT